MLRFRNIRQTLLSWKRTQFVPLACLSMLMLAAYEVRQSYGEGKSKGGDPVRVDEKGRKFVNKIPYDVFFDDPLGIVTKNKDTVAPSSESKGTGEPTVSTTKTELPANSGSAKKEGIEWENILSISELQSEVKTIRNSLNKAMTNQGSYKSAFKEVAIEGAELAALAGILQAHPESLSWKDKAHYVRDFGAAMNQSAVGVTKENFDNTKSAFQKLASVLDGSIPTDAGDVPESRPFNEAASRKGLMKRLEKAKNFLQQDINSEAKFKSQADQARHEASILAALGTVITTSGYEYTSEDDYQKHAKSLIDGGKAAVTALQEESFDQFKQAVDKMNKSCTDCHQSYGTQ